VLCCHSNATRAPIANPPNSAQLGGSLYHAPSYIRVRAVVWAYGRGQTHRHRRTWPQYILRHLRLTQNVMNVLPDWIIVTYLSSSDTQMWDHNQMSVGLLL